MAGNAGATAAQTLTPFPWQEIAALLQQFFVDYEVYLFALLSELPAVSLVVLNLALDILSLNPIGFVIELIFNAQLLMAFIYNATILELGLLYAVAGVIDIIFSWIVGNLLGTVPFLVSPLAAGLAAAVVPGVAGVAGLAGMPAAGTVAAPVAGVAAAPAAVAIGAVQAPRGAAALSSPARLVSVVACDRGA
ncbi:PPE family protein, partial [Mycobacterium simiae]